MADPNKSATLVHLRLTLSASELAHLPFELAKAPVGPGATAESWLAIQTRPPVCVTRNIRTVSAEGVVWPNKPRVLFISSHPAFVPFDEHRDALLTAIKPFRYPHEDISIEGGREQIAELMTTLKDPTLEEVLRECHRNKYTHVHILAHGGPDQSSPDSYGLVLRGQYDAEPDVVSGERFCSALTSVGHDSIHRPTVVTIAGCDSGNIGTVSIPGASFAHALHQAGIPLVVASQFPLSKEGSVPLAETMYRGLLWGEHPLLLLQRLRAELHARYSSTWQDWASLVVYEALPLKLGDQLYFLRYHQGRRALDAALEQIDLCVQRKSDQSLATLNDAVELAVQRLPFAGQYAVECLGLRASARKRLAQAAFALAARSSEPASGWDQLDLLEQAWGDYDEAVRRLLVKESSEGTTVQRVATLHWVLVQAVCLDAVLGRKQNADEGRWETAKFSADLYCAHNSPEERAYAFASLAELYLLRLAGERRDEDQEKLKARALEYVDDLVGMYPFRSEFPVTSTLRQFQRYVDWWGSPRFKEELVGRAPTPRPRWDALIETAKCIIKKLERHTAPRGATTSSPLSPPEEPGAPPMTESDITPPVAANAALNPVGPVVSAGGQQQSKGKRLCLHRFAPALSSMSKCCRRATATRYGLNTATGRTAAAGW